MRLRTSITLPFGFLTVALIFIAFGTVEGERGETSSPEGKKRCVLVIGIDGLRSDGLRAANTPVLDALASCGAVSHDAFAGGLLGTRTQQITSSGPGWSSIFTGVWVDKHRVRDNGFSGHRLQQFPHFFKYWKDLRPAAVLASFVDWEEIDEFIVASSADAFDHRFPNGKPLPGSYVERDKLVLADYERFMAANNPDGIALYLGNVDIVGHGSGFNPANPQYIAATEKVDEQIGRVLEILRARPEFANEDWITIITTDHGGSGTGHGGQSKDEREIFMIVTGSEVQQRVISPGPGHVAVPPTAMRHLGIPIDEAWEWEADAFGYPPYCPGDLTATPDPRLGSVALTWRPPVGYDLEAQQLFRDGALIAEFDLEASGATDLPEPPASGEPVEHIYTLRMIGKDSEQCPPLTAQAAFYDGPIETGQVARVNFDGDALDSLNGLTVTTSAGRFARDNDRAYLEVDSAEKLKFDASSDLRFGASTDFTIAFLVKAGAASSSLGTIVGTRAYSGSALRGWAIAATRTGSLKWEMGDGRDSVRFETSPGLLDDGRWHHVAVTHDRDAASTIFIDGIPLTEQDIALVGNLGSTADIVVGDRFAGGIDELKLWKRRLLRDEVAALANGYELNRPPFADAVVDLRLDGTTKSDVASGPDGAVVGPLLYADGIRGSAAMLPNDGTAAPAYVSLGQSDALNFGAGQDFTVSVWVKSDGAFGLGETRSDPAILSNKDWKHGAGTGWIIAARKDGGWQWNLGDGAGNHRQDYDGPAGQISDGAWHHIAVSHDRDGFAVLYFDGAKVTSRNITEVGDIDSGLATAIGTDGTLGIEWPAWFNGSIDNVQIWRRALSEPEVVFVFDHFSAAGETIADAAPSVDIVGNYAHVTYERHSGGFGTAGWNYTAGGRSHRLERSTSLDSESWESGPTLFRQIGSPISTGENRETVTLQSLLPIPLSGRQYFRVLTGTR